jgi:nucleotide-binding universal stress UspA family protein
MCVYHRIVVATDFSPSAELALEWATRFAEPFGAQLHLVHAWQIPVLVGPAGAYLATPEVSGTLEHELAAELSRLAMERPVAGRHLINGTPETAVKQVVEETNADLVVVGTQGGSGLAHVVFGSVAERILRTSNVPVVLISKDAVLRPATEPVVRTVMTPVELVPGDDHGEKAAAHALHLARRFGARFELVHAVDLPAYVHNHAELAKETEGVLQSELSGLMQRIAASAPEATAYLRVGKPTQVLLEHVRAKDVDLVVMRTHGHGAVERFFLGSMTETMIRKSGVPVLVLPAEAAPATEVARTNLVPDDVVATG